ncbi:hypothetical protein EV177_011069, partial [Coemansia sp. RSA 1804]
GGARVRVPRARRAGVDDIRGVPRPVPQPGAGAAGPGPARRRQRRAVRRQLRGVGGGGVRDVLRGPRVGCDARDAEPGAHRAHSGADGGHHGVCHDGVREEAGGDARPR